MLDTDWGAIYITIISLSLIFGAYVAFKDIDRWQ